MRADRGNAQPDCRLCHGGHADLKTAMDVFVVFDARRGRQMRCDEFAPESEFVRLSESNGVVVEGSPADGECVFAGYLDGAVKSKAKCAR